MNYRFRMLLCVAVLLGTVHQISATDTNDVAVLERLYGYQAWAGSTKQEYAASVKDWRPDFVNIGATNVSAKELGAAGMFYSFRLSERPACAVYARVVERPTARDAHHAIIEHFERCVDPQPFPEAKNFGIDVGDRCYADRTGNEELIFCRNNVFVYLTRAEGEFSLASVAEKLDAQLRAQSSPKN